MEKQSTKSTKGFHPLLLITLFITQLDSGILSTNLSSMSRHFSLIPQEKSWIVAIYTLGLLFATPIMGSLIDRYGYRLVFLLELGFYFIGVLGIALSQSFTMLLIFRVIQALGSSSILTLALSLVFTNHSKKTSAKVGNIGALVAFATIVAPIISVISLVKTHDWRSVYFGLAGVIAVLFILGLLLVPKMQPVTVEPVDIKGNTLFVVALLSFNLLLSRLFTSHRIVELAIYILVFALSVVAFLKVEKRREIENQTVLFSKRLWKLPMYRMSLMAGVATGLVMSLFAFLPSFIEFSFHLNARRAGSFMTIMAVGTLIGSKIAGFWVGKKGAYKVTLGSMTAVGMSLILLYISTSSIGLFSAALFLFGLTIGMLMTVPLQVLIVESSPSDRNMSLSLLSVTKKLGMTIGIMVVSIFAHATHSLGLGAMMLCLIVLTFVFVLSMRGKE